MDTTSLVVVGELANGIRAVYKGQVREDGKCDTTYLVVAGEGAVRTQRQRAGVVIVVVGVRALIGVEAERGPAKAAAVSQRPRRLVLILRLLSYLYYN